MLMVTLTVTAGAEEEKPLDLIESAPLELSEGAELGPDNRPPLIESVPDGMFLSEKELDQQLVESTQWDYFNKVRKEYRLSGINDRSVGTAKQLGASFGRTGIPLLSSEEPSWERWAEDREQLLDFNSLAAESPDFVTSEIDELNLALQVWLKRSQQSESLAEKAPRGATILFTEWNHSTLEEFGQRLDLASVSKRLGFKGTALREDGHGLTLEVTPLNPRIPASEAILNKEVSNIATKMWREFQPELRIPEIRIAVVDDPGETVDLFCVGGELRCPQMSGGRDIDTGGNCTTGFALLPGTNSQARALSTAGHCLSAGDKATMATIGDDSPPSAGITQSIGPYPQALAPVDNQFHDVTAIRPAAAERGQIVPTYHMTNTHANRPVEGTRANPPRLLRVCASARSNINRSCGAITDEDYDDFDITQYTDYLYIELDGANLLWPGDSGAPWTEASAPGIAVATIANGRNGSAATGYNHVISPRADRIANHYGTFRPIAVSQHEGYRDSFAAALYRLALQRGNSVDNLDYWSGVISPTWNTNPTTGCVADAKYLMEFFLQTVELESATPITSGNSSQRFFQAQRRVHRLYWTAFNRQPDSGGLAYWAGVLRDSANPEATWDWMTNYFIYTIGETNTRISGQVGGELGPCV